MHLHCTYHIIEGGKRCYCSFHSLSSPHTMAMICSCSIGIAVRLGMRPRFLGSDLKGDIEMDLLLVYG
jgi:hypothetical protein